MGVIGQGMRRQLGDRRPLRVLAGVSLAIAATWLSCSSGEPGGAVSAPPPLESLDLTPAEREKYAPISFDKLLDALEVAEGDEAAVETVIQRVNRKTVGWSGIVKGTRLVAKHLETNEYSVSTTAPSRAGEFFPTTVPVLFEVPDDHPVTQLEAGDPIVFVGRLEFDGMTREPWVLDSRLVADPGSD